MFFLAPFHRWGNWDAERLNPQLAKYRGDIPNQCPLSRSHAMSQDKAILSWIKVVKFSGLRTPVNSYKLLRIPKRLCFCGLHLPIFTRLKTRTLKIFTYLYKNNNKLTIFLKNQWEERHCLLQIFLMSDFSVKDRFSYLLPHSICCDTIFWLKYRKKIWPHRNL